jgi:hypothetical protein
MMESGETLLNNHWLGNRGGSLAFLVRTIINVLVMEIGWTDVLVLFYLFYHIFTVEQSRKLAPDRRTASDKFPGGPVNCFVSRCL